MTLHSDDELVARVVAGDTAVFELLMRRHNQRLFRVARAVMHDDLEAEDIVQETYLRAYANLARFERRASVATWLSRIAFHTALRRRRRKQRMHSLEIGSSEEDQRQASVDAGVIGAETRAMLSAAMDRLPVSLRAVVMLRLVEGLDTRETALSLHMTESNVKVCLHRARHMLCESIGQGTMPDLREEFAFAAERCDRIVAGVFARLGRS